MRRSRMALFLATLLVTSACSEEPSPTGPDLAAVTPTASMAADLIPSGPSLIRGVRFGPPIVKEPLDIAEADGSLLDLLAVEICKWPDTTCSESRVRLLTSAASGPARLHVDDDGVYHVVWRSKDDGVATGDVYRVRILASGGELGHVDVESVDDGGGSGSSEDGALRITAGSSLPIAFVVEEGAGERSGPAGSTVELADGQVTLDVPPGALSSDVFLTAAPVAKPETNGTPWVAGTAWDFGPDGIVFGSPVVMTIRYDPADIPSGVQESELRIHKLVNGELQQQNAGVVDLVNHTVSAEVDGFSVYVAVPRDPLNPEDVLPPEVRSIQVLDPATGTFGNAVTLDASAADVALTMRLTLADNGVGVDFMDVRWMSPSGSQVRFPCYRGGPPDSGSDTYGNWDCTTYFPRYAEAGLWGPQWMWVDDKINNRIDYVQRPEGFCDPTGTDCLTNLPQITVVSSVEDLTPPTVQNLGVGLDVVPRSFAPSVNVDVSGGPSAVILGFQASDDLGGVGGGFPFDFLFSSVFTGPSGQSHFEYMPCQLTQGTSADGFWECRVTLPAQAETGTWTLTHLRVPDRVGNGGWGGLSDFRPDGLGQLCRPEGNCVSQLTVEVVSPGDGEAPFLQDVSITSAQADVTTTLTLTDNLSGVTSVRVNYQSQESSQVQDCYATLSSGTTTAGDWACTITFSQFAARGQWILNVEVSDLAGNWRSYFRRSSDGFLCYWDVATGTQVCQDFGDTDLILS